MRVYPGSGTHIHVSCYDKAGNNQFANDNPLLHQAIAGMQQSLNDAMLLFAPHANSYRRYQPDLYVPMNDSWGYNNRTVALRIPKDSAKNARIEHRMGGADTNPYLAMAATLAGLHQGISQKLQATAPIEGNAYEQTQPSIPMHWSEAQKLFMKSDWVKQYFGADFQRVYHAIKVDEMNSFEQQITPLDYQWYLQDV